MSYQKRSSTDPEPRIGEVLVGLTLMAVVLGGVIALWFALGEEFCRQLLLCFGALRAH
jgi:hypothetical protein